MASATALSHRRRTSHSPSRIWRSRLVMALALEAALGYLFKRQLPPVRRVHADDAAMVMVVTSSVG